MKSFYREVIKGFHKMMPIEDILLKALTCLNSKQQKVHNSLQYCVYVMLCYSTFVIAQ